MAEPNPKSILKKGEGPTKAKRPIHFSEIKNAGRNNNVEAVIEAARRQGRIIRGLNPNEVNEDEAENEAENYNSNSSENDPPVGHVNAPYGPYPRYRRGNLARAATASGGPVSFENLQIVGFQRAPQRGAEENENKEEEEEEEKIQAKVCDMTTGICWLIGVSSLVAGYYLGTMGGGKRKTRRRLSRRKQTRKRN